MAAGLAPPGPAAACGARDVALLALAEAQNQALAACLACVRRLEELQRELQAGPTAALGFSIADGDEDGDAEDLCRQYAFDELPPPAGCPPGPGPEPSIQPRSAAERPGAEEGLRAPAAPPGAAPEAEEPRAAPAPARAAPAAPAAPAAGAAGALAGPGAGAARGPAPGGCEPRCLQLDTVFDDGARHWVHACAAKFLEQRGRLLFEHLAHCGFFEEAQCHITKDSAVQACARLLSVTTCHELCTDVSCIDLLDAAGSPPPTWRWEVQCEAKRFLRRYDLEPPEGCRGRAPAPVAVRLGVLRAAAGALRCGVLQARRLPCALRVPGGAPRRVARLPSAPERRTPDIDALLERVRQRRPREAVRCEGSWLPREQRCLAAVEPPILTPYRLQAPASPCTWEVPVAAAEAEPQDIAKPELGASDGEAEPEGAEEVGPPPAPSEGGEEAEVWDRDRWERLEERCQGPLREEHAQEAPRLRRARSWGRTLSYAKVALGAGGVALRPGTARRPFAVWVLCAAEATEAWLADRGLLDGANWADGAATEVLLLGEGLRAREPRGPAAAGGPPSVRAAPYAAARGLAPPDLAALLLPAPGAAAAVPREVLELLRGVPTVVSTRFQLQASDRSGLARHLLLRQVRCPFSACPEDAPAHDDNGWLLAVSGEDAIRACSVRAPPLQAPPAKPFAKKDRKPAVFWGILDVKFDTSLPVLERLKILEAGDGKTSKFSGDGKEIRERYDTMYRVHEAGQSTMHDIISSDKKFLHDQVEAAGYGHLLPGQACFPREYDLSLAGRVAARLGLEPHNSVILKLCNKTRAAGVVVVAVEDLDLMLRRLLTPPEDAGAWLREKACLLARHNTTDLQPGTVEENQRHWWSNESPVFLAERLCSSLPCPKGGKRYDGTLRVGFALRPRPERPGGLEAEWLGCYWKLPKRPLGPGGARQESVVSAARTSGTAPVDAAHCSEVYAALAGLLPRLFGAPEPRPADLAARYGPRPALAGYLLARFGASKARRLDVARAWLREAELQAREAEPGRAREAVLSFVHRWDSVLTCRESGAHFELRSGQLLERSLDLMPLNANTLYLKGVKSQQGQDLKGAVSLFHRSLALDPDFKAPYVYLGVCHLQLREWQSARDISEAGLSRHPSPQFHYHLGVAIANLAQQDEDEEDRYWEDGELREQWQRALDSLLKARGSAEAQGRRKEDKAKCKSPWLRYDDALVLWLQSRLSRGPRDNDRSPMPHLPDAACEPIGWIAFSCRV